MVVSVVAVSKSFGVKLGKYGGVIGGGNDR